MSATPLRGAMAAHFAAWLDAHVPEGERVGVLEAVLAFLGEGDREDLVGSRSWDEIRTLAERWRASR